MSGSEAFVSLVTNDSYGMGAICLGRSLRDACTNRKLALLITNNVSAEMRNRLSALWDELVVIEELDSRDAEHLALLTRPELGVTFSKIHAWRLTHYTKCVFLDADTLVLQNVDELFDREELSAAPDIGWPDCFNTGVFVFVPSMETFRNLLDLAKQSGSFDGGDQGLLNVYWGDWATKDIKYHLPFIYNVVPNVTYGYAPAFQRFGKNAKIIHFIGPVKPWQHRYLREVDAVIISPGTYSSQSVAQDFIRQWWHVYLSTEQAHCASFVYTDQAYVVSTESDVVDQPVISDSVLTESDVADRPVRSDSVPTESDVADQPVRSDSVPFSLPPSAQDQGVPQDQGVARDHPVVSGDPDEHRRAFETGRIDYTGRDSFQRIQEHLDSRLK